MRGVEGAAPYSLNLKRLGKLGFCKKVGVRQAAPQGDFYKSILFFSGLEDLAGFGIDLIIIVIAVGFEIHVIVDLAVASLAMKDL